MMTPRTITLERELASGALTCLYLATERGGPGEERKIAVELIQDVAEQAELTGRLEDQGRLLSRINHRHIVRVEGTVRLGDRVAVLMELINGVNARELMCMPTERPPGSTPRTAGEPLRAVPPRVALTMGLAVANALNAAHHEVFPGETASLNVVHRNVKPSSVMLRADGEVKLVGFITARFVHAERVTATNHLHLGSRDYFPPETLSGATAGTSADVYGLGLTLIELLSGAWLPRLPRDQRGHGESISTRLQGLRGLDARGERADDALRAFLGRMSHFRASERPGWGVVADTLSAALSHASGESAEVYAKSIVRKLLSLKGTTPAAGALVGQEYELLPAATPIGFPTRALPAASATPAPGADRRPATFAEAPTAFVELAIPRTQRPSPAASAPPVVNSVAPLTVRLRMAELVQAKELDGAFDLVLSHHPRDRRATDVLASQLENDGLLPLLQPRRPPGTAGESATVPASAHHVAVVIGATPLAPAEAAELTSILNAATSRHQGAIVILLPAATGLPPLGRSLTGLTYVDFRITEPDPYEALFWQLTKGR